MWFKHMDASRRKSPWKQDSPGRGGGKKPAAFFCHLLATEGLVSALPSDEHWGRPSLSEVSLTRSLLHPPTPSRPGDLHQPRASAQGPELCPNGQLGKVVSFLPEALDWS